MSLAAIPFTLRGVPMKLMADNALTRMASQSTNDRVLIILQMLGGNDGLNTLIPVKDYDLYYSRRANIAIPAKNSSRKMISLDSTLSANAQVGLHPDMIGMKSLYDQGRVAIVQGVSYKNNNGSHFRGRDINFMGGSFNDYFSSGWVGRYLEQEFAPKVYPDDFPSPDMLDPLAIELGSEVSLIFDQSNNIPVSISINDPKSFADLVNGLQGFQDQGIDPRGYPPAALTNSPYGKELDWILGLEGKSKDYAQRLNDVYQKSPPSTVTYPEKYPYNAPAGSLINGLTPQLQLIARLLDGGGAEFGRRIHSNGSYGTDHGTGGPVYIFGQGVKPGMVGTVPDLTQDNVEMQYDYRQVYSNILKDWMLVNESTINNDIFFKNFLNGPKEEGTGNYDYLPLAQQVITGLNQSFVAERFGKLNCYPNPAKDNVTISFMINSANLVQIDLIDSNGIVVKNILNETRQEGANVVQTNVAELSAGVYIYRLKSGFLKDAKKLIVIK